MEIISKGDGAFVVRNGAVVALNPAQAADAPGLALYSRRRRAPKAIVNGPGEYELGGVLVVTVAAGDGLAHAFDIDGTTVFFVDGSMPVTSEAGLAGVGRVDILLVRVDDLSAARELADAVAPRSVLAYGPQAAELCAGLGVKDVQPAARVNWNRNTGAPKATVLRFGTPQRRAARGKDAA